MKIREVSELLDARVLCRGDLLDTEVYSACGSDMMSDVLAYVKRTCEMMDMCCVVFVRSKLPTDEMVTLADRLGIVVLATEMRMYEACGRLYSGGLNPNGAVHE